MAAALREDMPLVARVNEDWDELTTGSQIMRPDWDFSPIRLRTMHHLPHVFFDTLRPERPDCPVLVPSSFSRSRDRLISLDLYCYEPCGLPTGDFMPAEKSQIRLMTASPITLRACIPAPDQVTPERAYYKDLNFYKQTLFHTPFLSRGRAVTLLEYRNAEIVFEVDNWFSQLPQGVQRYLLPLQSAYAKWYNDHVRDLTQNYSYCTLCKTKQSNLQRHHMKYHARYRTVWFCPLPGCPSSLSSKDGLVKHLMTPCHARGMSELLARKVAKQVANQNCFWPITQLMADKLLVASKRLIRYIALYSMAGVAMESKLFRIHPNTRDTPFMEACAAFLTPKMDLSQVMPSGCQFRRVAQPPSNVPALSDRPSASDYSEELLTITPDEMRAAVTTPVFQPYRGETGRTWMKEEYGVIMDTSSIMSAETERDDTDDDSCSFDLGPEPFDPSTQSRLPSDEWLDDHQQGLHPGSSEPRFESDERFLPMPAKPSLLDLMRSDLETNELQKPPAMPVRAPQTTMNWDFDTIRDDPPPIPRAPIERQPHSTPRAEPRTTHPRLRQAIAPPRPRAISAPPSAHPAKKLAVQYMPTTEDITPPATPPRADIRTPPRADIRTPPREDIRTPERDIDIAVVPDTPPAVIRTGRGRGRGKWRAQQQPVPRVGTRSSSRLQEVEEREVEEARTASARWPTQPNVTSHIESMTRKMHISEVPMNTQDESVRVFPPGEEDAGMRVFPSGEEDAGMRAFPSGEEGAGLRVFPSGEEDAGSSSRQPPAAGLVSRQQDTYFIPPPSRVVGGARGRSVPVSTATLGLIHRQDPNLAAQLRENPASLMQERTRRRVSSTIRLIRAGLIGQMASLQQWDKAMNDQDEL